MQVYATRQLKMLKPRHKLLKIRISCFKCADLLYFLAWNNFYRPS